MLGSKQCLCWGPTCDGCPAHQVGVGEMEGGVEPEVRLDNPPRPLADVIEQACAAHGHSALVAVLQEHTRENQAVKQCCGVVLKLFAGQACTCKVLRTVAPSNFSLGVCGDILPL